MQTVRRSVLVPYSAKHMYDLVDDVDRYCEFLPWCAGSKVLAHHKDRKTARIDIDFKGVTAHFTTDNAGTPPESIAVALKEGPFRKLHGKWSFRALGEDACKVEFDLSYEFATPVFETLIGPVFNHIAHTFIDAFVKRAEATYG
jgi:ribosome-associated toxin RatA of RatAB toxin-antitoxin module